MKYRWLGRSGLRVSEICLGTATFGKQADEHESAAMMDVAAQAGVNFIDTADVYPLGGSLDMVGVSEKIVGNWLKGKRDRFVLATKCGHQSGPRPNDRGSSRNHINRSVESSLRRLQTDYIDLYQMHVVDESTPMEEIATTLEDLQQEGKIRYFGVSNYPAWRAAIMLRIGDRNRPGLVAHQPRYNMLHREIENELVPLCLHEGIGIIAYNPLAGGFLTGRYRKGQAPEEGTRFTQPHGFGDLYQRRYWKDEMFEVLEDYRVFATKRGRSLAQVAVQWVLSRPGLTSAIVGASRTEQIRETLPAVDLRLTEEEVQFCNSLWYRLPRPSDPFLTRV